MEDMVKQNSLTFALIFLSCIYAGLAYDAVSEEFKARIEALEKQGQEQGQILIQQAAALNRLQNIVEEQNTRLLSQENTINDYKQKVQELELTLAGIKNIEDKENDAQNDTHSHNTVGNPDDEYNASEQFLQIAGNGQKIATKREKLRKGRLVVDEGTVAFHALISSATEVPHIGINQRIVFPNVLINLGGGFHDQHGLFIAPQAGIYIFSTSIMSYVSTTHREISVHLVKNGKVLGNAYAHGDSGRHDQGSVTVVTQLALGDEVWVSLYGAADTSLWGDNFDSFMGCLIVPM